MQIFYYINNNIASFLERLFILSLLFFAFNTNLAQSNNLKFENLGYEQGFDFNTVFNVLEDRNGFIWFACSGGLARYDGYEVVTFLPQKGDSTSISGILPNELFEDKNGILWIGLENGLNSYNLQSGKFTRYRNNLSPNSKLNIISICESNSNSQQFLWIGTRKSGLFKFYPDKMTFEKIDIYNEKNKIIDVKTISSINKNKTGRIFFSTHQNGLFEYNSKNNRFKQIAKNSYGITLSDKYITLTYYSESLDKLFIGTGNAGLYTLDEKTGKIEFFENSLIDPTTNFPYLISGIKEINQLLWITTIKGGLFIYNPSNNLFTQYLPEKENPTSIGSSMLYNVYQSRSGVIFLPSHDNGVIIYNPDIQKVNSLTVSPGKKWSLSNDEITAICTDKNNNLWISTSYQLNKFNFESETTELIKTNSQGIELSKIYITTFTESKLDENILWLGTYKEGVIKYNKATNKLEHFMKRNPLSITTITKIVEDKIGNLWISTTGWGLKVLNPIKDQFIKFTNVPEDEKIFEKNPIFTMAVVGDSSVWLGTLEGLYRCSLKENQLKKIFLMDNNNNIDKEYILTLKHSEVNKNILWIGTGTDGLFKYNYKTSTKTQYTVEDGLLNNTILGIVEIGENVLWLSYENGVSKFNYKTGTIQNYSLKDGFLAEGFNVSTACSYGDSIVCFGGVTGVNYFNTKDLSSDTSKPKVILTELLLFNQKVEVSDSTVLQKTIEYLDELILNYTDYIFSVKFTSPNFKKPNEIKYAYQLAGFNDDWIYTSAKNRMATFTNIPDGEYLFKVKAANSAGIWNEDYASLKIVITPPFWKTWWAYLFYLLFVSISIFSFIRWRINKEIRERKKLEIIVAERTKELKELNDNKDRFFSIVAHDIKTPIIAVLKFSKILKNQYQLLSEEERVESISDIHDWLNVSYRYLTNLLDWSRIQMEKFAFKPQNIVVKSIVTDAIKIQESQAELQVVAFSNEIDENLTVFVDYEMILVVLTNLISNAVKFSNSSGVVKISAEKVSDKVQIFVRDYGIGIEPKVMKELFKIDKKMKPFSKEKEEGTGLGLILSKELIKKNSGEIKVESILGESTTMTIQLPIGKPVNE